MSIQFFIEKSFIKMSSAGDLTKTDFPTNVKDWIAATLSLLNLETPDKYINGFTCEVQNG